MSAWIKWTKDLETDSRVVRMARELKRRSATRNADQSDSVTSSVTPGVTNMVTALTLIVGSLVRFWSHADSHVRSDNTLDMGFDEIDEHVGIPGFAASMPTDWLVEIDSNTVELPNFQEHNGIEAKKKALNAKRQSNYRIRNSVTSSVTGGTPKTSLRPDQTRLDQEEPEPHSRRGGEGETDPPERKRRRRVTTEPFDPSKVSGLDIGAWNAWLQYRAERKPAIKPCSMQAAAEELAAFGSQQAAVVRHSKANGYQGLVAPKTNGNGTSTRGPDPAQAERDALELLRTRRNTVAGLKDFRDPLPGETSKQYRAAQDAAWQAHQDSKLPQPGIARVTDASGGSGTFAQLGNILSQANGGSK